MDLPVFKRGMEVVSAQLNKLSQGVRRATITSVIGGSFMAGPGGTTLIIDQQVRGGGGATGICPFQVTPANEGDTWKIEIAFGVVNNIYIPEGMTPGGYPPYILNWQDGWVVLGVSFVADQIAIDSCWFEIKTDIPTNTTDTAYYPVAYINTKTVDGVPTQQIQNFCSQPSPSVCDLQFQP